MLRQGQPRTGWLYKSTGSGGKAEKERDIWQVCILGYEYSVYNYIYTVGWSVEIFFDRTEQGN